MLGRRFALSVCVLGSGQLPVHTCAVSQDVCAIDSGRAEPVRRRGQRSRQGTKESKGCQQGIKISSASAKGKGDASLSTPQGAKRAEVPVIEMEFLCRP